MLSTYKLLIAYRGNSFAGWQSQRNGNTVQDKLNWALKKIAKSEQVSSLASGRTDAGVHAVGQVVRVQLPLVISADALVRALNSNLPSSIRIRSAECVDDSFHPIRDVISKEYRYFFTNRELDAFFLKDFIGIYPYPLEFNLMQKAADLFVGEYDFHNFYTVGSSPPSTIREILEIQVEQCSAIAGTPWSGEFFVVKIRGKGFLKQMVRSIVGAIWDVGRGHSTLQDLEASLLRHQDRRIGSVAPAAGLYLWEVEYQKP